MSPAGIQLHTAKTLFVRKISRTLTLASFVSAVLISASPLPAYAQVELVVVDVKVVMRGWRASKLKGTNVTNDKNEKIGEIDDIILSRDGAAIFAIIQVGGFLGVGGHLIAVPFKSLQIDDTGKKIVLPGASRDALKRLPEYKHPA
jgi:sporulation protein YlmC with PRC-barrel domain